jgi:hypothetical protein
MSVVLMMLASGCKDDTDTAAVEANPSALASASTSTLPCSESEQRYVAWDVPGPGRPTPEEAVAPHAGALTLVAHQGGDGMTVLGLRTDGTVFRVFDVTQSDDGWWPDGYRECSS